MSRDILEAKLKFYDRFLATITALGIILGGFWGVYTYVETQHQSIQLRQRELALRVFKEKKNAYLSLIDAAGEITASKNRQEVIEKAPLFLKLYYGRAHVIAEADPNVSDMKIAFKGKLMTYLKNKEMNESPFKYFSSVSFDLTNACKSHIDPRTIESTIE